MQPFDSLMDQADKASGDVREVYDAWASDYDKDLAEWGYDAPETAAGFLRDLVPGDVPVLDAGCGTGMTGVALKEAGFQRITGIDYSADSVALARRREIYEALSVVDLTALPTAFPDGAFGGLICVGVMSYLPAIEATCREFCRLVEPGGAIVLTQRADIFTERDTQGAFDAVARAGLWQQVEVTEPRPYLPGNPEFDGVGVRYGVFRRV